MAEYKTSRKNPRHAKEGSARTGDHRPPPRELQPQRRPAPVRPRRRPLHLDRRRRRRRRPAARTRRTRTRCSARCCGSTRAGPRQAGATRSPRGNPFVGKDGADEIYSYGLRNPFRFSFDGKADRDRRRRPGLAARRSTTSAGRAPTAPTSAGTPSRAVGAFDDPDASPPSPRHGDKPRSSTTAHSHGCSITGGYVSHDPRIAVAARPLRLRRLLRGRHPQPGPEHRPRAQGAIIARAAEPVRRLSSFGTDTRRDLVHEPEQRQGLRPEAEEVAPAATTGCDSQSRCRVRTGARHRTGRKERGSEDRPPRPRQPRGDASGPATAPRRLPRRIEVRRPTNG